MRYTSIVVILSFLFMVQCTPDTKPVDSPELVKVDSLLTELAQNTDDALFRNHLESMSLVLNAEKDISEEETNLLTGLYEAFQNDTLANPSDWQPYLNRERIMMLAWESPDDGKVTFSWMKLPKDYDPDKEYPLYVYLHGFWDVAEEPISYMSFPFLQGPTTTTAFEDGFFLSPWGRGNEWYHGQSKTDIWESIAEIEKLVNIDQSRKYLSGHSMGGYGTWHIAQESAETWAAIGLHSAALQFKNSKYVSNEYASNLKSVPTYIVYGIQEDVIGGVSDEVYTMLQDLGNQNIEKITFDGAHDWNDSDVEAMYEWMKTFKNE